MRSLTEWKKEVKKKRDHRKLMIVLLQYYADTLGGIKGDYARILLEEINNKNG